MSRISFLKIILWQIYDISGTDYGFTTICTNCAECKWYGTKIDDYPQWKLGGPRNSRSDCIQACRNQEGCNYVSHSISGYCHMSMYCEELDKKDLHWGERLKKVPSNESSSAKGKLSEKFVLKMLEEKQI